MKLTGYSDRWSVRPGERIAFHIHAAAGRFDARLVRLRHGDENPRGPGFRETAVASAIDGTHDGGARTIRPGSCGIVQLGPHGCGPSFTVAAWFHPTAPGGRTQGVLAGWRPDGKEGFSILLNQSGRLEARVGEVLLSCDCPIDPREWHFVTLSCDAEGGRASLFVHRLRFSLDWPASGPCVATATSGYAGLDLAGLVFAATRLDRTADGPAPRDVFDGKLARPRLLAPALDATAALALASGGLPDGVMAAWDFAREVESERLVDAGPHGLHGATLNRPARLMTGPFWDGDPDARQDCDAIHFHSDDVGDVDWPETIGLTIPPDLPSGVYALRLRAGHDEDHLPFFVCPPRGAAGHRIAVLMPTLSYLAYANESLDMSGTAQLNPLFDMTLQPEAFRYVADNGLRSTYDRHADGSGICYSSLRRPVLNFRPRARARGFDAPHQFPADLHLIDWLEEKGFDHDVITDHELHAEGAGLLGRYRVVLTGSHPEYWSRAMIEARDAYLAAGGRLMYLGGNGFYWVAAVSERSPWVIEVRRFGGTRTWQAEPGEVRLSLTGEMGGLWRDRGRAPQRSVGVGFSGQGFDRGVAYRRTEASRDPAFAFVFAGVPAELIGAGPSLVLNHGAAGFEVDKADPRLGTPAHAVVLASSLPFSDAYQFVVEETLSASPWSGGSVNRQLGADLVFLAYPNGGAVFSVGSIIWTATLSASGYDGDTSRITANVLRAFAEPAAGWPG